MVGFCFISTKFQPEWIILVQFQTILGFFGFFMCHIRTYFLTNIWVSQEAEIVLSQPGADTDMSQPRSDTDMSQPVADTNTSKSRPMAVDREFVYIVWRAVFAADALGNKPAKVQQASKDLKH